MVKNLPPRVEAPDPRGIVAWQALLRAHRSLVERLDQELRAAVDLPLEHYDALYQLRQAPEGRLRMSDLATRLLVSRSSSTRIVDRLAAAGLVERGSDPTDRRVVWVTLTPEGRAAQRRAGAVHLGGVARHFVGRLSPDELDGLTAVLGRLGGPEPELGPPEAGPVAPGG